MDDDRLIKQWAEDFKRAGHQIPEIMRSARKSAVYQYVELVINIASCLLVFGFIAYFMINYPLSKVALFLDTVTLLVIVVFMILYFKYRRGTWRAAEKTPRGLLRFLRKQEEARLREAKASKILILLAIAAPLIIGTRKLWIECGANAGIPVEQIARTLVSYAVGAAAIFFCRYWTRRKRRNLEKVALLEKSFDNGLDTQ